MKKKASTLSMLFICLISIMMYGCLNSASADNNVITTDSGFPDTFLSSQNKMLEDSFFKATELPAFIREKIQGKSFLKNTPVSLNDLRYIRLLHYDDEGSVKAGEIICNKLIAEDLADIFKTLYEQKYPIQSIRLIEDFDCDDERSMAANNTSCFNTRHTPGRTRLSRHAYGLAVDINPLYNPYVRIGKNRAIILPKEGKAYINRKKTFPHKIDASDLAYKEFMKRGFKWGGNWKNTKDYQHFEK